jgi:hypothetical protein
LRRVTAVCISLILALAALPIASSAAIGDDNSCSENDRKLGTCNPVVSNDGTEVGIGGTKDGGGGGSSGGGGGSSSDDDPPLGNGTDDWGSVLLRPTLSDLVNFRPTPGIDHMEPNGWFIEGLDANFYATGGSSVQSGTLLGLPARVRFTPVAWTWTYGDGKSATRTTPGATWKAQHIREFDPTPTSHIYTKPGTYYIDLTLTYRAEYTWGSSAWLPIDGNLYLPANRLRATVGDAKTVLFNENCAQNPSGAGC